MRKRHTEMLKVVIGTSLVWLMVDVVLIMYFMDCGSSCKPESIREVGVELLKKSDKHKDVEPPKVEVDTSSKKRGFIGRFLPDFGVKPVLHGENGQGVTIPADKQDKAKEMFKINQFNLMASDMISVNRSLPDIRSSTCLSKDYDEASLPETSVIIVFHNEAWSTLLRSVHSIVNRSPRHLLKEIILVDDASERDFLGEQLEKYVARLSVPVRVLRMGTRSGLIRARLKGASEAKGKVLTFLDAHIECSPGWLPPLLYEIRKDRQIAVAPVIDRINLDNFAFEGSHGIPLLGGFKWGMSFHWIGARPGSRGAGTALRSPTMAGGLFSIERDYFYEIGSYDSGMDIWGGENLEMSFRIWMCGGQLLISTCSHVGHVFRKVSPYSWPGGVAKILNKNSMRTVVVWLDEYQHFYRKVNPGCMILQLARLYLLDQVNRRKSNNLSPLTLHRYVAAASAVDYGDVSERQRFRQQKQCKSFSWYLEQVYPEAQIPLHYHSLGEVRQRSTGYCLDTMGRKHGEAPGLIPCHKQGGNQVFSLTAEGLLQCDDLCVEYGGWHKTLHFSGCNKGSGAQKWRFEVSTQMLKHLESGMCLGPVSSKDPQAPSMVPCAENNPALRWELEDYKSLS